MNFKIFALIGWALFLSCISRNDNPDIVGNPLYVYTFSMEKLSIEKQARLIDSLGFSGFAWSGFWHGYSDSLDSFYSLPEARSGRLKLLGVFFFYNLDENRDSIWLASMPAMADYHIPLWPIFYSQKSDSIGLLKKKLFEMCNAAEKFNLDVIIYPHDGSLIESAEEALPFIRELKKDNLFLSFHLCHELRAGNGKRIGASFREVLPWVKFVTISGADTLHCKHCSDWSQDIKPLDEGPYDTQNFYRELKNTNYQGPVVLQTYGIQQAPQDHLSRSIKVWESYIHEIQ